ncbi:NAD-dependent epimerase/dehydratase family protein [Bacillus salacetis]|nr:NAD-dependent epimerase/dehydratase family protein [Bacillus salacetis]
MKKTVLITGASGFTGTEACRFFSSKGYAVTGIIRGKSGSIDGGNYVKADLLRSDEIQEIMAEQKPDFVLHLAGDNHAGRSWSRPSATFDANVNGTLNLLESVRLHAPSSKILVAGSLIDFNPCGTQAPNHPYGVTKYLQVFLSKCWAQMYSLDVTFARPANLIGPGESTGICALLAAKLAGIEQGEGKGNLPLHNFQSQRDFLDVRDAVKAYELIFREGGRLQEYALATGISRTLGEVAQVLVRLTSAEVEITYELDEEEEPFAVDTSEIRALGWQPEIPFEQSMADILNYHRTCC